MFNFLISLTILTQFKLSSEIQVAKFESHENKGLSESFKLGSSFISSVESKTMSKVKCLAQFSQNKQSKTILFVNKGNNSILCSAYSALPENSTQVVASNTSLFFTRKNTTSASSIQTTLTSTLSTTTTSLYT